MTHICSKISDPDNANQIGHISKIAKIIEFKTKINSVNSNWFEDSN